MRASGFGATRRLESASTARAGRRLWLGLILVVLGVALVWRIHAWWVGPARRIAQFADAANGRQWQRMLALADPAEVEAAPLTTRSLTAVTDAATADIGSDWRIVYVRPVRYFGPQRLYNRSGEFRLCGAAGAPGRGNRSHGRRVSIVAYKTDRGWMIALTRFVRTAAGSPAAYAASCSKAGLRPRMFMPEEGEWRGIPAGAQTARP